MRRALAASVVSLVALPVFAEAVSATVAAPAAPVITTVVSSNKSLAVNWTESTTGASFVVSASAPKQMTRTCHTTKLTCSIVALKNGVAYSVTVKASNAGGSATSAAVSATPGVPSAPLGVHVKATKGGFAAVAWNPPVASGVTPISGYTASATNKDGSSKATCSTTSTSTTPAARTCKLSGLTKGVVYSVTVTATNSYGTSGASKTASFTAL
jgi:hypothetical protein